MQNKSKFLWIDEELLKNISISTYNVKITFNAVELKQNKIRSFF